MIPHMAGSESNVKITEIIKDFITANLPKEWKIIFKPQGGHHWAGLTASQHTLDILEEEINIGNSKENRNQENNN